MFSHMSELKILIQVLERFQFWRHINQLANSLNWYGQDNYPLSHKEFDVLLMSSAEDPLCCENRKTKGTHLLQLQCLNNQHETPTLLRSRLLWEFGWIFCMFSVISAKNIATRRSNDHNGIEKPVTHSSNTLSCSLFSLIDLVPARLRIC